MITLAKISQLEDIYTIIKAVSQQMKAEGNEQWAGDYPTKSILKQDILQEDLFVYTKDHKIKGLIVINSDEAKEYNALQWKDKKALVAHRLAVHPAYQRNNIAKKLMTFFEKFAISQNIDYLKVDTYSQNKKVIKFLKKLGYHYVGDVHFTGSQFGNRQLPFQCFDKLLGNKDEYRKVMMEKRSRLSFKTKAKKDLEIYNKIISHTQYKQARNIFVFVSYKDEVDTHRFIMQALADQKNIFVPKVNHKTMDIYKIESMDDLEPGYHSILEPKKYCQQGNPKDLDLIILPGLAFDYNGNRLGYGGGYYDRFMMKNIDQRSIHTLAIAYDFQIIQYVPVGLYDLPVDEVISNSTLD